MTFSKWLETNNGKYVEVAGSATALNQCTDLANSFIRDVLNFPIIEWTNAIDFPKKAGDRYQWIPNSPSALPEAGDLMIFKLGAYGHISVFIEGNLSSFRSFDQNYPLGTPAHVQNHTYSSVTGWLHPLNVKIEDDMTEEQKRILDFLAGKTEGDVREAFGALADLPNLTKQIDSLKASQEDLEDRITILEGILRKTEKDIEYWQSEAQTANGELSNLKAELEVVKEERQTWKNRYENKLKETLDKQPTGLLIKEIWNRVLIVLGKK